MRFQEFEKYLLSEDCFNNHDVSIIDKEQRQHYIVTNDFTEYQACMAMHIAQDIMTIKVDQMERFFKREDRTVHVFYNPKNGPTFPEHSDDVDVIIECMDGTKWMELEGKEICLKPGEMLYIPKGAFHRALNHDKALMASHGIGDTASLERIRKNN